jgi:hypothetical protein
MLKLQLLTLKHREQEKMIKAGVLCGLVLAVFVVLMVRWVADTKAKLDDMKAQASAAQANAQKVQEADGEIAAENAKVQPYDDHLFYVLSLRDFSKVWPQRMKMLARFISDRADLLDASLTAQGFTLHIRTKTTADVANVLMTLKQSYKARLVADGTINIAGLGGWPNPTSPRGWGPDSRRRLELPYTNSGLSEVGSSTETATPAAPAGGGPGSGGAPGGSSSGPPGSPGMGGPGSPGSSGGAPGGLGAVLNTVPPELAQMLTTPLDAARRTYISPSVDPPPQPYLALIVTGTWYSPIPVPGGGGGQGQGGPGGMPGGRGGGFSGPPPGASPGGPASGAASSGGK